MKNKIILAVGAHPDDIDFGASGTIAKWIAEGATAYYLICTDGSRGSSDPKMTHRRLAAIRQKEQLAAARILGVKGVYFLNFPDTQLVCDLKLKERIVWYIRKLKPQVVITMDPIFYYSHDPCAINEGFINHTDHRAAALATMDAVFPLARDRLTFPEHDKEGLASHKVEDLYFIQMHKKETVIDVTESFEKKLEAIAAHTSQFDDSPAVQKRITDRAILFAEDEKFKFGESFIRLIIPK